MTNFDPSALDWASGPLAGWTYDKPVNKWFQGEFRRAHRLTRPCPTCRDTIVLDVTAKALGGSATNHGLALRRCKKCREALKHAPQDYAERKALGAERRAADPEEVAELEKLRKENEKLKNTPAIGGDEAVAVRNEMLAKSVLVLQKQLVDLKAEAQKGFNEAGAIIANLRAENAELKRKLAAYDLPAAMAAMPWQK